MSTPSITTTTGGTRGTATTNITGGLSQHASAAVASRKRNESDPGGLLKKPRRLSAADSVNPISNGSTVSLDSLHPRSPTRRSLRASSGGASSSIPPPSQTGPGGTRKRARPETASSSSIEARNGQPAPDRPLAPGLRMTPQASAAASAPSVTETSGADAARPVTLISRAIATQSRSPVAASPALTSRPPAMSPARVSSPSKSAAIIALRGVVDAGRRGALADAAEVEEMSGANDLLTLKAAADSTGNGSGGRRRCRPAGEAVNMSTDCDPATDVSPGNLLLAGNVLQQPETGPEEETPDAPQPHHQTSGKYLPKPGGSSGRRINVKQATKRGFRGGFVPASLQTSIDEDYALVAALFREQEDLLAVRARIRREIVALQEEEDEMRATLGLSPAHPLMMVPSSPPRQTTVETSASSLARASAATKLKQGRSAPPSQSAKPQASTARKTAAAQKAPERRKSTIGNSSRTESVPLPAIDGAGNEITPFASASATSPSILESRRTSLDSHDKCTAANNGSPSDELADDDSDGFNLEEMLLGGGDDDDSDENGAGPDILSIVARPFVPAGVGGVRLPASSVEQSSSSSNSRRGRGSGRRRGAAGLQVGMTTPAASGASARGRGHPQAERGRAKPRTNYSPIGADAQVKRRPTGRGGASLTGSGGLGGRGSGSSRSGHGSHGGHIKAALTAGQGGNASGRSGAGGISNAAVVRNGRCEPSPASSGKTSKQRMIEAQMAALDAASSNQPDD